MDLKETQAAVLENSSKRRKEDDVTREMMEGAAQRAVGDVMLTLQSQLQAQQQFLLDNMNGSVKEAVINAVNRLTSDLHSWMQTWEGKVETQMQKHWDDFEKK